MDVQFGLRTEVTKDQSGHLPFITPLSDRTLTLPEFLTCSEFPCDEFTGFLLFLLYLLVLWFFTHLPYTADKDRIHMYILCKVYFCGALIDQ